MGDEGYFKDGYSGGLNKFIEDNAEAPEDGKSWVDGGSEWLNRLSKELFDNWRPLICRHKSQWYRRATPDDPWEPYDPEEEP